MQKKPSVGRWDWWKRVGLDAFRTFTDPDTSPRCAATAFFGFLSIFPTVATVMLIFGLVADTKLLLDTFEMVATVVPRSALPVVAEQMAAIANQPRGALGLGLLISIPLALWSGSRGVDALLFAMSRVKGAKETRGFVKDALVAIGFTAGGALFLVIALITIAGLPALVPFPTGNEALLFIVRWPVLMALTIGVLMVLYRWGPDRHPRRWRFIWPGALLASLLWILAGTVFSIYVENWGNYNETFGSVSAAVVLLLWMYNSAQIFVLGAAFNAAIERDADPAAAMARALAAGDTVTAVAVGAPMPPAPVLFKVREAVRPKLPWLGLAASVFALFVVVLAAAPADEDDDEREAA